MHMIFLWFNKEIITSTYTFQTKMQVVIARAARHAPDALSREPRSPLKAQGHSGVRLPLLGSLPHSRTLPPRPQNSPGPRPSLEPTTLRGRPKTCRSQNTWHVRACAGHRAKR